MNTKHHCRYLAAYQRTPQITTEVFNKHPGSRKLLQTTRPTNTGNMPKALAHGCTTPTLTYGAFII
jgi:hypothetical protein